MSRLLSFSKIKLKLGPPESIPAVKLFCLNERFRMQIVIRMPLKYYAMPSAPSFPAGDDLLSSLAS